MNAQSTLLVIAKSEKLLNIYMAHAIRATIVFNHFAINFTRLTSLSKSSRSTLSVYIATASAVTGPVMLERFKQIPPEICN